MNAMSKARQGVTFKAGSFACAVLMCGFASMAQAMAGEDNLAIKDNLAIIVDRAEILRIPDRAAMVVIGNPLIADAALQPGGLLVLTGKGYGATNFIVLDAQGQTLLEHNLQVRAPDDNVVVYRGLARETYSCLPICQRRNTLGDAPEYFNATLDQSVNRSAQASK